MIWLSENLDCFIAELSSSLVENSTSDPDYLQGVLPPDCDGALGQDQTTLRQAAECKPEYPTDRTSRIAQPRSKRHAPQTVGEVDTQKSLKKPPIRRRRQQIEQTRKPTPREQTHALAPPDSEPAAWYHGAAIPPIG